MLAQGTRVKMSKGYKGIQGNIELRTDSRFELYVIHLDNGIRIVGGPSSFTVEDNDSE